MQTPSQTPSSRGTVARAVAGSVAFLVVLGLAGIIFALHTRAASAGVTATTPPDAVHVLVTRDQGYSTVPDPRPDCPKGTTCITTSATPSHTIPYDKTITDTTTVRRLQRDLNGPNTGHGYGGGQVPPCAADVQDALKGSSFILSYDFTFTAHGQPVERVVVSARCSGLGLRSAFAPNLTLGAERGAPDATVDALMATYPNFPHDPVPGTGLEKIPGRP